MDILYIHLHKILSALNLNSKSTLKIELKSYNESLAKAPIANAIRNP